MILKYIVKKEDANKTINQILKNQYEFSNRLFSKLVNGRYIFLNGKNIDTRLSPKEKDILTIDLNYKEDNSNIIANKMNLDIVYEDEGLLLINKPAGVAVHPSIEHYKDSLASGVKYYFESKGIAKKIRPVNRLDLNTSGLIVFAKNEYIQECLIRQMKNNIFKKEYLAIVDGYLENKKGIIDEPIARKENSIIERCVSKNGKSAITEYEVIKEKDNYSLIKCKLLTGRTHQIRVHFAYIGHPLIGDTLYGKKSNLIDRQALHSCKISFCNPITGKNMSFENIPDFLEKFFKNLIYFYIYN